MKYAIREIETKDHVVVAALLKEQWKRFARHTEFIADDRFDSSDTEKWLVEHLAKEGGIAWVAESNNEVIGAITAEIIPDPSVVDRQKTQIHVVDVVVAEKYRRNGIATALEVSAEEYGREQGAHMLTGEVWAYNAASRAMMPKLGRKLMYEVWAKEI